MNGKLGIVLLHGAGLGGYIWDEVLQSIENPALQVEFPHRDTDEKGNSKISIQEYCDFVSKQIENWETDNFIIVAHSIGGCLGLVMNDLFNKRTKGFIGIGAVIPKSGQSFADCFPFPQNFLLPLILKLLGTKPPENALRNELCSDLTQIQSDEIIRQFNPESIKLYTAKVSYDTLPNDSLYVKLLLDQAISSKMQKSMINNLGTKNVTELESGHMPMYSKPRQLAEIIQSYLDECSQKRHG